jgi:ribosomal protein S21
MKKSQIVRNMIAAAKAQGVSAEDIIAAVMADTGFKRQLARAYILNNWEKVDTVEVEAVQEETQPEVDTVEVEAVQEEMPKRAPRELSQTPSAIRKREARARARAALAA